jgi:hypothetical protein
MNYPKIQTLWKRDPNNKNRIIEGQLTKMEFDNIKTWMFTEKIDGTNIRVTWENGSVKFDGRTDDAQIPSHLYNALSQIFPKEKFESTFPATEEKPTLPHIILFGEGYGPKIRKGGGLYRDDAGFILFDVWIDGWWLDRPNVKDIANKMGLDIVPLLGIGSMQTAIDIVKSAPNSLISKQPKIIEGIVARSYPLVLFRDGDPLVFKLKVRDYTDLQKV